MITKIRKEEKKRYCVTCGTILSMEEKKECLNCIHDKKLMIELRDSLKERKKSKMYKTNVEILTDDK